MRGPDINHRGEELVAPADTHHGFRVDLGEPGGRMDARETLHGAPSPAGPGPGVHTTRSSGALPGVATGRVSGGRPWDPTALGQPP